MHLRRLYMPPKTCEHTNLHKKRPKCSDMLEKRVGYWYNVAMGNRAQLRSPKE